MEDEHAENEQELLAGRETLARSLLRYLTDEELASCNTSGKLNAPQVLTFFKAVYEDGDLKMDQEGAYGDQQCSCGCDILYIHYIQHIVSGEEIMVGSRCILRFDYRLREALKEAKRSLEIKQHPLNFCSFCRRKNKDGDHFSCLKKQRMAMEQKEQAERYAAMVIKHNESIAAEQKRQARAEIMKRFACHVAESSDDESNCYKKHTMRWYFDINYSKKHIAKNNGALWDNKVRLWYATNPFEALQLKDLGFTLLQPK